jgi:hypothetical protein
VTNPSENMEPQVSNTANAQPADTQQFMKVKLPPFWPHLPALWFSQAESLFMCRGLTDQVQRYYHLVSVLPHESLRLVADIVEVLPAEEPYITLKQRLMASHQLTGFQRAEKLL